MNAAPDTDRRRNVQRISGTHLAVSPDPFDRMYESVSDPEQ
jgi:hypothetical protein